MQRYYNKYEKPHELPEYSLCVIIFYEIGLPFSSPCFQTNSDTPGHFLRFVNNMFTVFANHVPESVPFAAGCFRQPWKQENNVGR
ncbi:MAG: hypothetical protein IKH86_00320 [Prevotella sp.]|nr:hypothetical protein [Prevotella sp.]